MLRKLMIALLMAFCGCSPPPQPSTPAAVATEFVEAPSTAAVEAPAPAAWDDARSADVYEAIFRHQFMHNASAVQQKAGAYFLSVLEKDPPPEFLKRFDGHRPSVRPGSAFKEGAGVKFRLGRLKWIDDNTVEVSGGYYETGESASGNLYRVVRKEGKWVVEKDVTLWISWCKGKGHPRPGPALHPGCNPIGIKLSGLARAKPLPPPPPPRSGDGEPESAAGSAVGARGFPPSPLRGGG